MEPGARIMQRLTAQLPGVEEESENRLFKIKPICYMKCSKMVTTKPCSQALESTKVVLLGLNGTPVHIRNTPVLSYLVSVVCCVRKNSVGTFLVCCGALTSHLNALI